MIAVAGIVVGELPIAFEAEAVGLADHDPAPGIAIEPFVDHSRDRPEMLGERQRVEIERTEDETAIGLHARHLRQIVFRIAHVTGVAVRPGYAAQPAGIEEIPAVVRALERLAVALVEAAQRRAAMGAAVIERADFPLGVAHDDQRTQSQAPGDKIVDVGDFAFVREIGPRAAEDLRHLGFEDRRIGVDQPVRAILLDQILPVVERGATEAGRRRADFLQRRHVLLRSFAVRRRGAMPRSKEIEILILFPLAWLVAG